MGNGRLDTLDDATIFIGPRGRNIVLNENANGRDGVFAQGYFECIIDGAHVDYQDQIEAGCGEQSDQNPNWWSVDISYGFSFDETTDASCKKMLSVNRRLFDGESQTTTDVTEDWKAIDWNLEQNPWLAQGGLQQV